MFSKIFVMSTLSNSGATTISNIIAHMLAERGIDTSLFYTDSKNDAADYFGLVDVDAQPSNISIVASSISETNINRRTILDYSHKIPDCDKLHILNIGSETIDEYSRRLMLKLLLMKPPTQVNIFDISQDLSDETILEELQHVDAVFVVINMSQKGIDSYLSWKESNLFPDELPVIPIVNMYNEHVAPIQQFSEYLQLLPSQLLKVHYNPYINLCTLMKSLYEIYPQVQKRDPRVAHLYGDFERIYQTIVDYGQKSRFNFNMEDLLAKVKHKVNA